MGKSFERIIPDSYDESFELDEELKYGNPPEYFVKAETTKIRRGYYKKLGPLIGITKINELGDLRIAITRDLSKKIPPLSSIQGNLQTVNFLRDYYGFNPISQEEYDAITTTSQEVAGKESEPQEPQIEDTEVPPNVEVIQERTEEDRTPTVEGELGEEQPDDDHDSQGEEKTLGVTPEQEAGQNEIIFPNKEINNLTFNLSRYTGDDDQRFAIIEDDLEELGLSEEEIKNYISQKGIPEIPSTSIQIGDEYFDWWDRHISGYSYKELALSEYYGINLNHNPAEVEQLDASAAEDAPSPEVSTNDTAFQDALDEAARRTQEEAIRAKNTEVESRIQAYSYPTRTANTNDYIRGFNLPEWLLINSEEEQELLIEGIKSTGIMPDFKALSQLDEGKLIKVQKTNSQVSGEYLAFINATRKLYGLPSYGNIEEDLPTDEIIQRPDTEQLSIAELESYLNKEVSVEEIERLKQESLESIQDYQEYAATHLRHTRNQSTQEEYCKRERFAWYAVNRLAHIKGGNILTLPHYRDIQLSSPEEVNLHEELESLGYKFNPDGDITHIQVDGHTIQLDRPRSVNELLEGPRPAHVLYGYGESILADDDKHKYYTGYIIKGLNKQVPDYVLGKLSDKSFLGDNIVEDMIEENPVTDEPTLNAQELESTLKPEIDISEYEGLGLQEAQLSRIKAVMVWARQESVNGLTVERVLKYTGGIFGADQAREIFLGFHQELTDDEVSQYSNPDMSAAEMKERRRELVEAKKTPSEESEPEMEAISDEEKTLVSTESDTPSDKGESIPQNEIDKLRVAYARAEEFYNRNRRDEDAKAELDRIREEYNQTIEKVFGIMVAEGLEQNIHKIFAQEVYNLREARITQSKELQSGFERAINPIKEKLLNFAIKNKKLWAGINIGLAVGGGFFALSGAGFPVAGALEATRRFIASTMAGVSAREGTRALLEDADVRVGKLKWQSVIPKLVAESLQDGYVDAATDTDLSTKLSTLEAYYRLNGGKFTNESQQKAYEAILMKLGERVQKTTIKNNQSREKNDSKLMQGEANKETSTTAPEIENVVSIPEQNNPRYTSELLKTMSEKRIKELQKQQRNRLIANVVGTAVGGGLMTSLAVDMMRPGGVLSPEQVSATLKPEVEPISPNPEAMGGTSETAKAITQNLSPEQLQDISELSSGETLWEEVAKRFGENATDAQIQQGVEAYMGTSEGQETMFSLASQTKGGRALLSQWGIDNAAELSQVSKSDLFKLSRHLGVGELKGLDTLDLSNLPPLEDISTPTGFNPTESTDSGINPPGPGSESVPQVDTNTFVKEVSEVLGVHDMNLTEQQIKEVLYAYNQTEQGRESLYNLIELNDPGSPFLSQDFSTLSADDLYEISQSMDIQNLEGFSLDNIILSRFENAPDTLTLFEGGKPLNIVDNYIAKYAGDMPGSRSLGKLVLEKYVLETDEGRTWLYEAIMENKDRETEVLQKARELFYKEAVKSPEDLKKLLVDKNGFPSAQLFWDKLSRVLKPGTMPGIKKALQLVLAKQ